MKLYHYYDQEADILYSSQGKPSAKDISQEAEEDVVLRLDPKTRKVRGFTILNFNRRLKNKQSPVSLPIEARLLPVK
jgi:uncharacterized protein YuzE